MQFSKNNFSDKHQSYFIAMMEMRDGSTKLAHGKALDLREFDSWLRLQYKCRTLLWHQSLTKSQYNQCEDIVLEVVPELSPDELEEKKQNRKGAEDALFYANQILNCLNKKPDIIYIAVGPVLVCPDLILYVRVDSVSHSPNYNAHSIHHNAFITGIIGHIMKNYPNKQVIEVSSGGLRRGHRLTCRHRLDNFIDVRYFHKGDSPETTHQIQSHVFLFWQMMNEKSPYAINLGEKTSNLKYIFPKSELDFLLRP